MASNSGNLSDAEVLNLNEFEFNRRLLLNVIAYTAMCVLGTVGNVFVFLFAYQQHKSPENQGRNNVHLMVIHLTIADLMVAFVVMPLEIGWRLSVQWYAGNVACKLLMFVRAFAFYLSSMTLVSLSIDRCLAIAQPLAALKKSQTRNRGRVMLVAAWASAAVFALPQTLVFRVLKHPQIDFLQCTSMNFFQDLMAGDSSSTTSLFNGSSSALGNETAAASSLWLGLTAETLEKLNNSLFLVAVYVVPLIVIVITYANILRKLFRKSREERSSQQRSQEAYTMTMADPMQQHHHHHSQRRGLNTTAEVVSSSSCSLRRNRSFRFARSQTVALRMSTMHVLAFVGCWTPYLVISLWHIFDPSGVENVSAEVQDVLFLTAVCNSCINPLVYGGFYFKALKNKKLFNCHRRSGSHNTPRYSLRANFSQPAREVYYNGQFRSGGSGHFESRRTSFHLE